jgi:hypothetical protein
VTRRADWVSSNPAVAVVHQGVVVPISAGSATITPSFPGAAPATGQAFTVTA